jgi:hypothetical protein
MSRTQVHRWRTVRQDCYRNTEAEERDAAFRLGFETAVAECQWMRAVFTEPQYPGVKRKVKGRDTYDHGK